MFHQYESSWISVSEWQNFDDLVMILRTGLEYQTFSKGDGFQASKEVCLMQYLSSGLTNVLQSVLLQSDFIFRHEMQHFVNNLERYVVNQIIHVSWQEFQQALASKVHLIIIFTLLFHLYLRQTILEDTLKGS